MEKMKGVMPQKNSPELVAGNKDVVEAARKMRKSGGKAMKAMKAKKEMGKMAGKMAAMRADRKPRKSGGMCSSDWSAAQGEGQKPRG
jgi:hypothetical protein